MSKKASIWQKSPVLRALSGLKRAFKNWYEGAVWWDKSRSFVPEYAPQDARFDLTTLELHELIRKSRYFVKNVPLVQKLRRNFKQYTAGHCGITMVPASSDPKYNAKIKAEWKEFCKSPDRTSYKSWATLNGEAADTFFTDGNYLILPTFEDVPNPKPGEPGMIPKIQLLEIHRLRTPDSFAASEGKTIHNGIQVDDKGKPLFHWIADGFDGSKVSPRASSKVIHVFESHRPGQYFGEPLITAAINRTHDLDDLQILQMRKAKQNASVANVLETESGEITDEELLRQQRTDTTQDSQGTDTDVQRFSNYQRKLGGDVVALRKGEKLQQHTSESPSVTEQWHWEKCEEEICVTAGQSRMLVFPDSVQGTVARADLEVVAAFFRSMAAIHAEAWLQVYHWWLDWAVNNKPSLKNPPLDYKEVEYRAPRGVNVDLGWNSAAVIDELDKGIRTIPGVFAELQEDYRERMRSNAIAIRYTKDLAKEFDLEPEEIWKPADAILDANQAAEAAKAQPALKQRQ